jgi:hypothetical protein
MTSQQIAVVLRASPGIRASEIRRLLSTAGVVATASEVNKALYAGNFIKLPPPPGANAPTWTVGVALDTFEFRVVGLGEFRLLATTTEENIALLLDTVATMAPAPLDVHTDDSPLGEVVNRIVAGIRAR